MAGGIEFSSGKFKELALLLTEMSSSDPRMSRVKLNKLLYQCDFEAYRLLGQSITGETYIKGERGPMASHLPMAEDELGAAGLLEYRIDRSGRYERKVPVALQSADRDQFTQAQLDLITRVRDDLKEYGAWEVSEWSHEESVAWNVVKELKEELPYDAAFVSSDPIPEEDLERAKQFVRESGWVKPTR